MPEHPKLLIAAVDLSADSISAWHQAAELALMMGASVEAVHVLPSASPGSGAGARQDALRRLRSRLGQRARLHILRGKPADVVVRLAADLRPCLIVMGTEGRTGLERLAVGSTAEAVIRRSCVPVLTVRRAARPRHVRSILAPVALTHYGITELALAAELAEDLNASLTLLHLDASRGASADIRKALEGVVRKLPARLRERCAVEVRAWDGDPADGIVARSEDHDLVAMVFHRKHILRDWALGTTVERVLRRASVPILSYPQLAPHSRERARLFRRLGLKR